VKAGRIVRILDSPVAEKTTRRSRLIGIQLPFRPIHEEYVVPAVIVIVKNGNTTARGFDDVGFLLRVIAGDMLEAQTGASRYILETYFR
jgi:hypothetical protein